MILWIFSSGEPLQFPGKHRNSADIDVFDFCQNDPRNNDIVIKTEPIQNSDENQICSVVKMSNFDGISALKTEPGT